VITGLLVATIIGMMVAFRSDLSRAITSLGDKVRCAASGGEGCGSGGTVSLAAPPSAGTNNFGLVSVPPVGAAPGGGTATGTPTLPPGGGTATGTPTLPGGGTATGTPSLPGTASGTPPVGGRPKVLPGLPDISTPFGPGVDDIINSTTLFKSNAFVFARNGYRVTWGEPGAGSYINRTTKLVVIDPKHKGQDAVIAGILAHEMGHAFHNPKHGDVPKIDDPNMAQWVLDQMQKSLDDEGEAILKQFQIRDAQLKEGQPPITIFGNRKADYEAIYQRFLKDRDREKARREIGELVGKYEHPSTAPGMTYADYYATQWGEAVLNKNGVNLSGVQG
jgi:type VI secretion system secreted protein VgrG